VCIRSHEVAGPAPAKHFIESRDLIGRASQFVERRYRRELVPRRTKMTAENASIVAAVRG
jgi:hypothetical protein